MSEAPDYADRYRAWCSPCGRFASTCCSADPDCLEKARANAPPPNRHERRRQAALERAYLSSLPERTTE